MKKQLLILALCASVFCAHAATVDAFLTASIAGAILGIEGDAEKAIEDSFNTCMQSSVQSDPSHKIRCFEHGLRSLLVKTRPYTSSPGVLSDECFATCVLWQGLALYCLGDTGALITLAREYIATPRGRLENNMSNPGKLLFTLRLLAHLSCFDPAAPTDLFAGIDIKEEVITDPLLFFVVSEYRRKKRAPILRPSEAMLRQPVCRLWRQYVQIAIHRQAVSLLNKPVQLAAKPADALPRVMSAETLRAVSPERTGGSSTDLLPGGTKDLEVSSPKRQRRRGPVVAPSVLDDMPRDLSALDVPADLDDLFAGI